MAKALDQFLQNFQVFITNELRSTSLAKKSILAISNLVKLEPFKCVSILFIHAM